jgi:dienelactone hydrolase
MKNLSLVWACCLGLAACQGSAAPTTPPSLPAPQLSVETMPPPSASQGQPPASPVSPVAALTPPAPVSLMVTAPDGLSLAADFYPPLLGEGPAGTKSPGVLLLHMYGRSKADWAAWAAELQKRGIAALAVDLRGQGQSGGPEDWAKAPADVSAAWQALIARPEVDPQHCAIVGASIGANLALIAGANTPGVATVIALSPGLDYKGVQPVGYLGNFGQRAVLLVASQDDAYSYTSVQQMAPLVPKGETNYFAKAGHGMAMFSAPTLSPLLLTWLENHLGVMKG